MIIDDYIVQKYLSGKGEADIRDHWIFHNIEKGEYLFQVPDPKKQREVKEILVFLKDRLKDFTPLNEKIYSALFPQWKSITDHMNVLLVVGCPDPYDAMVISYGEEQYIVFDLMQFSNYKDLGYDIELLIKQLITHETAHLCLHKEYPSPVSDDFHEKLKYVTFNEGFAHILAFTDNIEAYDFTSIIDKHFNKAFLKLQGAMKETDMEKQKELLQQSNSGYYWDKFAAISGKLFLASNLTDIQKLYRGGVDNFITSMKI